AIDPDLGPAYSALAEAYYYEVVYGFVQPENDRRQRALELAQKAVALDRDDAGAHCTLGRIRYLCRDYAAAISELEIELVLTPAWALPISASVPRSYSRADRKLPSRIWNRQSGSVRTIPTWGPIWCASPRPNISSERMMRPCALHSRPLRNPASNGRAMRSSSQHWDNWVGWKKRSAMSLKG